MYADCRFPNEALEAEGSPKSSSWQQKVCPDRAYLETNHNVPPTEVIKRLQIVSKKVPLSINLLFSREITLYSELNF